MRIAVLLAAVAILSACQVATPRSFQVDRPTRPGERLWVLDVEVSGLDTLEVDQWVAGPLLTALDQDGRADVVAVVSQCEKAELFLRSRVHLSSIDILSEILTKVSLPDLSRRPTLSPTGISSLPGGLAQSEHQTRVIGTDIDQVESRLATVRSRLSTRAIATQIPERRGFIRADLDDLTLWIAGVRSNEVHQTLRNLHPHQVLTTTIKTEHQDQYPLSLLGTYSLTYIPDKLIRLEPHTYAGYLILIQGRR